MLGKIEFENDPVPIEDPNVENLISKVSIKVKYLTKKNIFFAGVPDLFYTFEGT